MIVFDPSDLEDSNANHSIHRMDKPVVTSSPDVFSGIPVFAGTRVPVHALIECLSAGDSIDEFLEGFPSVTREQVLAFLAQAEDLVVAGSHE